MWNLSFSPPEVIEARALTRLPDVFRQAHRTDWADADLAFRSGTRQLVLVESQTGTLLEAHLPSAGLALFSHS